MEDIKLLKAKRALFKMISQYHRATKIEGKLCIYNYCQSALEASFEALGIEKNYIPLEDFCQMWEDNERAIWKYYGNEKFESIYTKDLLVKGFIDDYNAWLNEIDEENE
jgi:hypothetical protein